MSPFVRQLVRDRAGDRCEYCRLPQRAVPDTTFRIEHVVAVQHGGPSHPDNLALACDRCNLIKGPNLSGIDPETGAVVRLFHPRHDSWLEHFGQVNYALVGLTDVGRATVGLLHMNTGQRIRLRVLLRLDLTLD